MPCFNVSRLVTTYYTYPEPTPTSGAGPLRHLVHPLKNGLDKMEIGEHRSEEDAAGGPHPANGVSVDLDAHHGLGVHREHVGRILGHFGAIDADDRSSLVGAAVVGYGNIRRYLLEVHQEAMGAAPPILRLWGASARFLRSYVSVATNTSLSGTGSMRTIALYFQGNINHGRTACCCCLEGQAG
jgi:hypothetical protein